MTFPALPDWINRESIAMLGLVVIVVAHAILLFIESRRNPLIRCVDIMTADNGRMASNKTFQAWAFWFTAWGMYYLIVTGKAGGIELSAWGALWIGGYAYNKKQNNEAVVEVAKVAGDPPPLPIKVSDKT